MNKKMLTKHIFSVALACAVVVSGLPVMPQTVAAATGVPTNLVFSQEDANACTISWNAVEGATYNIYKADSRYASYSKVDTVDTNSYTDTKYDGGYYKVTAVAGGSESEQSEPISYEIQTFGYNTNIFEETDDMTAVQAYMDEVYKTTEAGQFVSNRYAFLFAPGTYTKSDKLNVDIGFYTQVAGLGLSPEDTVVDQIRCKAEWMMGRKYDGSINYNALCNFWRSVENLTVTADNTMWAVSQATAMRRMNLKGTLELHQQGGYASGGFLADTKVAGRTYKNNGQQEEMGISAASQQQWLSRNVESNKWDGNVWNYVFVGCEFDSLLDNANTVKNGPDGEWPYGQYTKVTETPVIQEKPFLALKDGAYGIAVPKLRTNATGVSWDKGDDTDWISLTDCYVAKPGETAAQINAAIKDKKGLIFAPGIYEIDEAIQITNADTVVLGLGYATLKPTKGNQCMTVADVDGVKIAGMLFDAGRVNSDALLTVGETGSGASHASNPIALCDTFFRVGGADSEACKTTSCVVINSKDVIGDNFWVWRADHGAGVAWDKNTCDYGVIINGANATTYGLMVEHFQKYQTQWNADGGRCYMYQSELPYDIPSQDKWNAPGSYGYTDYKVADTVKTHEGYGIGIYSCYMGGNCYLKSAVECPDTEGVKFTNVCTYSLNGGGSIDYAINTSGYAIMASGDMCKVMSYNNGTATADKTADRAKKIIWTASIAVDGTTDFTETMKKTYTGKAITPTVTVTYKGVPLRENTDYTVKYSNNTKIGKATITVTGINGFTDSTTYDFTIIPGKTKIAKKKATKKKVTLTLSKVKGANGYQVLYSTNKKLKKSTKINTKKTKVSFKRKKKGTYYVRARAYYKSGKTYTYGKYTAITKIR